MLNAILANKASTIETKSGEVVPWRKLYRSHEDLLTATVIERLSYLPSSLFFRLLRSASFPKEALPRSLGQLEELKFWPALTRPDEAQSMVEPDAIITFERGVLIIEAKKSDRAMQFPSQWAKEWAAYHYAVRSEELFSVVDEGNRYLVALGGLERNDFHALKRITEEAQRLLDSNYPGAPPLKAVGCSWIELSDAIRRERKSRVAVWDDSGLRMILKDLEDAFRLHEFRGVQWIDELAKWPFAPFDDGLIALASHFALEQKAQARQPTVTAGWPELRKLIPITAGPADIGRFGNV